MIDPPEGWTIEEMRLYRETRISILDDPDLSGEALESAWIADDLRERGVDKIAGWKGPDVFHQLEKEKQAQRDKAIDDFEAGLEQMASAYRAFRKIQDGTGAPRSTEWFDEIEDGLRQEAFVMRSFFYRMKAWSKRPPENQGREIRFYSSILHGAGFSIKATSRILADAFGQAGLESEDLDRRAGSIRKVVQGLVRSGADHNTKPEASNEPLSTSARRVKQMVDELDEQGVTITRRGTQIEVTGAGAESHVYETWVEKNKQTLMEILPDAGQD